MNKKIKIDGRNELVVTNTITNSGRVSVTNEKSVMILMAKINLSVTNTLAYSALAWVTNKNSLKVWNKDTNILPVVNTLVYSLKMLVTNENSVIRLKGKVNLSMANTLAYSAWVSVMNKNVIHFYCTNKLISQKHSNLFRSDVSVKRKKSL